MFLIFVFLGIVYGDNILFYVYADFFFPLDFCHNTPDLKEYIMFRKINNEIHEYRCQDKRCVDCSGNSYRKTTISRKETPNIFDHLIGDHIRRFSLRFGSSSSDQAPIIRQNEIARIAFNTLGDCQNYRTTNINYVKYNDIPSNLCFQFGSKFYKCGCKSLKPDCHRYNDIKCSKVIGEANFFQRCNERNEVFMCGMKSLSGKRGVVARLFRQFYLDDEHDITFVSHDSKPYCIRSSITSNTLSIDKCSGKACDDDNNNNNSPKCKKIVSSLSYQIGLPSAPPLYYPGEWPQRGWLVVKNKHPENLQLNDIAFVQKDIDHVMGVEYIKKYHLLEENNFCEDGERCECYNNELHCVYFLNSNCTGFLDIYRGYEGKIQYSNRPINNLVHVCDHYVLVGHLDTLNNILYGVLGSINSILILLMFFLFCIYGCCRYSQLEKIRKYFNIDDDDDNLRNFEEIRLHHHHQQQQQQQQQRNKKKKKKKKKKRKKKKGRKRSRGRRREREEEEEESLEEFLNKEISEEEDNDDSSSSPEKKSDEDITTSEDDFEVEEDDDDDL